MNTPCLSIFSTYSICHHTIFIHSNVVLVYQTFKRKRAIADRGGAQAKYLEKVVAPDKSNSPLDVVAISPDPQNTPTLADSSPTTLVISDAPTQQTPTAANSMIMPVDIAPASCTTQNPHSSKEYTKSSCQIPFRTRESPNCSK